MSVTLTRIPDGNDVWGRTRVSLYDVTLDTSYPNSTGYVIQASDVGLKAFKGGSIVGSNKAAGAAIAVLDTGTNGTGINTASLALRVFAPTGGATATSSPSAAPSFAEGAITNGAISIAASTATPAAGATPVTSTGAQPAIPVTFGAISQASSSIAAGVATAGVGKEFANASNLSTFTYRVVFYGL